MSCLFVDHRRPWQFRSVLIDCIAPTSSDMQAIHGTRETGAV